VSADLHSDCRVFVAAMMRRSSANAARRGRATGGGDQRAGVKMRVIFGRQPREPDRAAGTDTLVAFARVAGNAAPLIGERAATR